MNIAVCEDNAADSALLCDYIRDHCEQNGYAGEIASFESGEALLEAFSPGAFDVIFLDIFLPGMSGMDAARRIREADEHCLLLFITVSPSFALDGFEVMASGYVVKPIDREKMDKALRMCRAAFEKSSRTVEIPLRGESVNLPVVNIRYIEVFDKTVLLHLHGGVVETRLPLDELEILLGGAPFLRCHRSYIVNMNHVEDIRAEDFLMRGGDVVPMRKNGRRDVKLAMARFMAGRSMEAVRV